MSLMPPIPPPLARIAALESRFAPPASRTQSTSSLGSSAASLLDSGSDSTFTSLLDSLTGASDGSSSDGLNSTGSLSSLLGTSSVGRSTGGSSGATGTALIEAGAQYLGVPYKWGGTDPSVGLDCSGFVQRACADVGIKMPRVSRDQARVGTEVPSLDQARPGDIIAFGKPVVDHVAIYMGNGKIMQAPHTGDVVKISPIGRHDIASIRRVTDGSVGGTSTDPSTLSTGVSSSVAGSPAGQGAGALRDGIPYRAEFAAAAQKYGLDPTVLAAVAKVESGFNPDAVSGAGATGLMQFMPSTAAGMGIDASDPAQAIDGAGRYLSAQLARFGNLDLALAAYNAGPRAVERSGGIPPYTETRNYVRKVHDAMNQVSA
jgi:cell wall-associated NlpC family hydrolase